MPWSNVVGLVATLVFFGFVVWCVSRPGIPVNLKDELGENEAVWRSIDRAFDAADEAFKEADKAFKAKKSGVK